MIDDKGKKHRGKKHIFSAALLVLSSVVGISGCFDIDTKTDISRKPVIDRITVAPTTILVGETSVITVEARDLNNERLSYVWSKPDGGEWVGTLTGSSVTWKAPASLGALSHKLFRIVVRVQNEHDKFAVDTAKVIVNQSPNPTVTFISPLNGDYIPMSAGTVQIHAASSFTDTYSMRCYIDNLYFDSTTTYVFNKNWNVSSLPEGPKRIKIIATRPGGLGSKEITVSIEGTIGKRKN